MANDFQIQDGTGALKTLAAKEGADNALAQEVMITDGEGTNVIGTTTSAAVTTDTTGTVIGFLRGIVSWFARLGGADGAAFTSGSSYVWAGLGGVYQTTVGTLTTGQRGLARLTSRRAVVTAGDEAQTVMFNSGGTSGATDGDIRSTAAKTFLWTLRSLQRAKTRTILFSNGLDQSVTVDLYNVGSLGNYDRVAQYTIAAGGRQVWQPVTPDAGAATNTKLVAALLTQFGGSSYISVTAAGIPTTGTFAAEIVWSV